MTFFIPIWLLWIGGITGVLFLTAFAILICLVRAVTSCVGGWR